MGSIGKVLW